MDRWTGRVALVTGGSLGIGEAIAREFLKHGMKVAACARNVDKFKAMIEDAKSMPGTLLPIKCDVKKEDEIEAMFKAVKQEFGGVDILVNNAGIGAFDATLLEGTNQQWRDMLEVNVLALAICSREAVTSMKDRGVDDGHVINISSMSGHRITSKEEHFYAVTKHGVKVLTEGLRSELRETNSHIRVTSISPGNVATDFVDRALPTDVDKRSQIQAKLGPPIKDLNCKDIVDAVVYAVGAPPHVQVHDILIRPTEQKM